MQTNPERPEPEFTAYRLMQASGRELAVELVGGPHDGENALVEDRCDEPGCGCSIVGGVIVDDDGSVYRIVRCEHGHVFGFYEGQRNAA